MDKIASPIRLQIDELTIGYKGHTVATHLCGEVCPFELTCLLGSNGTGKSTLLRTLAGLLPALSGRIRFCFDKGEGEGNFQEEKTTEQSNGKGLFKKKVALNGEEKGANQGGESTDSRTLNEMNRHELARHIAVVLTSRGDTQGLTVREAVALGRLPYTDFMGRLHSTDHAIVREAMAQTNVLALAERRLNSLSDGERQKVMIAKALAQQTPIILLDEPTAFLDYPSKVETMTLLRRLAAETGRTILLSTHDMWLAAQMGHRFLTLGEGLSPTSRRELEDYLASPSSAFMGR